jgi:hypothetical protein
MHLYQELIIPLRETKETIFTKFFASLDLHSLKVTCGDGAKIYSTDKTKSHESKLLDSNANNYFCVLDIGGTNTRIICGDAEDGKINFQSILKYENSFFQIDKNYFSIQHFFQSCMDIAFENNLDVQKYFSKIAVIWSNAASFKKYKNNSVTAIIKGRFSGKDYLKGEWFIKELFDGVNLAEIFESVLNKNGIYTSKIIFGNDTVFVGNSSDARIGIVCSTGTNMAVCDSSGEWFNLECGERIILPYSILSESEKKLSPISIQQATAGKFLVNAFKNYYPKSIVSNSFELTQNFSKNVKENIDSLSEQDQKIHYFCHRIIGLLAALISSAVLPEIENKVVLDSKVLESLDPELEILKKYLSYLIENKKVELTLFKEQSDGLGAGVVGAINLLI